MARIYTQYQLVHISFQGKCVKRIVCVSACVPSQPVSSEDCVNASAEMPSTYLTAADTAMSTDRLITPVNPVLLC